jgi:hypothetical protein
MTLSKVWQAKILPGTGKNFWTLQFVFARASQTCTSLKPGNFLTLICI